MAGARRPRGGRDPAAHGPGRRESREGPQPRRRSARLQRRDWADLPSPALFSILRRLPTFADLLAFGGVCRAWRAVSKPALPDLISPVLCCTGGHFYSFSQRSFYRSTLPGFSRKRPQQTELPATILGFSQGYLIMGGDPPSCRQLCLINPFTGDEVASVPRLGSAYSVEWAVLTAPPSSPGCVLMAWRRYMIGYWRPGDLDWSIYWCQTREERTCYRWPVALEGAVYALSYYEKLLKFEFVPRLSVTTVPGRDLLLPWNVTGWLVACGGEILAIRADLEAVPQVGCAVYRLDRSGGAWVSVETLGGRALLLANFRSALCDDHPEKWGGEGNCVYYYCPHESGVKVFHMEGGRTETLSAGVTLPGPLYEDPRPVWVLPRMCC